MLNDYNRDKCRAYRQLCKERASDETADVLEYIRGERDFDGPDVRVVIGEGKKEHLRGRTPHKKRMRNINMYKDYDKLMASLQREQNMRVEAIAVDWSNLPFPNARRPKPKRSPPKYEDIDSVFTTNEMMTKAGRKRYEKEAALRRKESWASIKTRPNPLDQATPAGAKVQTHRRDRSKEETADAVKRVISIERAARALARPGRLE
jgi:hypothetical protein